MSVSIPDRLPEDHPMLAPWPENGEPPWAAVDVSLFAPAFETALAAARADIATIADEPQSPTFSNTMAPLENAGAMLDRVGRIFGVYASCLNSEQVAALELQIYPKIAAFADEMFQNATLFARISTLREAAAQLAPDEARLVNETWRGFVRAGARVDAAAKARIAEINQRLSSLGAEFSQILLAEEEESAIIVDDAAALDGAPAALVESLRTDDGRYRIANTRSVIDPILTGAKDRDLRRRAFQMFAARGDQPGRTTHDAIRETLTLRHERSRLLGHTNYADWALDDTMAKTPAAARALLEKVLPLARVAARREIEALERLAGHTLEPHDVWFHAERLRKARFDYDDAEVRPYLALSRIKEAMMWCAGALYGLEFARIDRASYHPDVEVYRVTRDGGEIGLWLFDPFARAGKQSGAWMNDLRSQQKLRAATPIVTNNSNFVKPADGSDPSISWDDAVTMFHEFGHALHSLNSNVRFVSQAGTSVSSDFVELPSQLNERWLSAPETMRRFLTHRETGEAMPASLRARILKAKTFMKGVETCEYLASAYIDLDLHEAPEGAGWQSVAGNSLSRLDLPAAIAPRHRAPHFQHVFAGEGYAAGYWSYMWADVLACDAAEAFMEAGDWFDAETARRYRETILSVGDSIEPAIAYRNFRGRDADPEALLRDRGLA
jgi:peptidyl-dipeptidase Dcp